MMKPTNAPNTPLSSANTLFLAVIFFWFAQYVYIPFQTPYLNSIGAGAGMIGLIVGAYGISQMALRLPVGILADRQNRHKQLIILGGASSGLASMFRVVMQNETGFLIGNLFSGFASAMWISFMVLYMSFYSEAEQRKATSRLILANNLGMLMGFVVSTLTYEIVGMRIICLSSVAAGILCVLCAAKLPAGEKGVCTVTIRQQISVCKSKNLLIFSLLALIQQGVQMSTTMSFTAQVIEGLGAKGLMIGISSVIYMMSGVLWARFASTESCGRISSKVWISLVFCINGIYCVLVPHSQAVWQIWCLQILPGMSTGILFSCLTAEAMKGIPARFKSTAMGFYQAVYALGMTTFPILCGKIAAAHSIAIAYYVLAGVCVVAAFLVAVTNKQKSSMKKSRYISDQNPLCSGENYISEPGERVFRTEVQGKGLQ